MLTWTAQLNVSVCVGHCFWKVPKSLVWSLQTSAVARTRPCGSSWCACGGRFELCRKTDTGSTRTPEPLSPLKERIKRKITFRFRQRNVLDVTFLHKSTYIHYNHFFSSISYWHLFQYSHYLIATPQWFRSLMQNCSLTFKLFHSRWSGDGCSYLWTDMYFRCNIVMYLWRYSWCPTGSRRWCPGLWRSPLHTRRAVPLQGR